MSGAIIEAEKISKLYHLGVIGSTTIRDSFDRWWHRVRGKKRQGRLYLNPPSISPDDPQAGPVPNSLWALKDVSFEIHPGEVVGILGKNGAGKSTLLKILSRITEPTSGRAVLRGRISSLLEVGTGFHSDLTGRENTYLNGAILGMRKREIERKFDAIVAFAELDTFIDTPVKHYSSGMYMRLAFAVAAFLESEILLIDEVLAVGDAAFQKKCLGKMGDISSDGRTILFVSHNMQAVQSLCKSAFQIEHGTITASGDAPSVVSRYLNSFVDMKSEKEWPAESAPGTAEIKLLKIKIHSEDPHAKTVFRSSQKMYIDMHFEIFAKHSQFAVGFELMTSRGESVLTSFQTDMPSEEAPHMKTGVNVWRCTIPVRLLNAGTFYICPRVRSINRWVIKAEPAVQFDLVQDHLASPFRSQQQRPGTVCPLLEWEETSMREIRD